MNEFDAVLTGQGGLEFLGLAPFLRASIAGVDLRPVVARLLQQLVEHPERPELLMNLAIAAQCLNQKTLGLDFQREALTLQRSYHLPPREQPERLRLLVLVTEGSIQANTPLDCLLEISNIELIFHFVLPGETWPADLPAHDVLFVGVSDSDANRPLLNALAKTLAHWPQPVLNAPSHVPSTGRDAASHLLQNIPRLRVPDTCRVTRAQLNGLADGSIALAQLLPGLHDFPIILRPLGSQGGADLQKIDSPADVATYLAGLDDSHFFMAPFVDYSDAQGLFKKIRVALIDGEPFVCHMGVSTNWMIHYVNAGMYEDAWKRQEESRFMNNFPAFVQRHGPALQAIADRMQLEYLVMDCAETRAGDLLLFEIDHGGVVHAMDDERLFPYKNAHILKAKSAFCALLDRVLAPAAGIPSLHTQPKAAHEHA